MIGFIAARRKGVTARRDEMSRREKAKAERRRSLEKAAKAVSTTVKTLIGRAASPPPTPSPTRAPAGRSLKRQQTMAEPRPAVMGTGIWKYQWQVRLFYNNKLVQYFVAGLIMATFVANVIEKQIDPTGTLYTVTFKSMEDFFNLVFLVELLVNAYGHWLKRFWCSSWNVFDFIVVCVGCISLSWFNVTLPGAHTRSVLLPPLHCLCVPPPLLCSALHPVWRASYRGIPSRCR